MLLKEGILRDEILEGKIFPEQTTGWFFLIVLLTVTVRHSGAGNVFCSPQYQKI